jgi:hypothetical protein
MKMHTLTKEVFRNWRSNLAVVLDKKTLEYKRSFSPKDPPIGDDEVLTTMRVYIAHCVFNSQGAVILRSPMHKMLKSIRFSPLLGPEVAPIVETKPVPTMPKPSGNGGRTVLTKLGQIQYVEPGECQCRDYVELTPRTPEERLAEHHPMCVLKGFELKPALPRPIPELVTVPVGIMGVSPNE